MKKTVDQLNVRGKRVLVRLDLNVPLDAAQRITDDRRIREALPTVHKLLEGGGRLVLMSHLGRPEKDPDARRKFSLAPVARRLGELLRGSTAGIARGAPTSVRLAPDCIGDEVRLLAMGLGDGDVLLLENLRFHEAEQIKDKNAAKDPALRARKDDFAGQIASLGEAYVNDAFGTCHRDNASMLTVPQMMPGRPRAIGYLVQKELKFLGEAVSQPARPFVCILGGAKVSDKLGVIRSLMGKCDTILIGGAMAYTFLAAEGVAVGNSLVEPDLFVTARALRKEAGARLMLPVDSAAAPAIKAGAEVKACEGPIPAGWMGLDIGPRTVTAYEGVIGAAQTIVWNGPMGVFETPPFDRGTRAVAQALAAATVRGAVTIIGGGDSAAAIDQAGLADRVTHISTGGGASLEFLEGKPFAALDVLDDA
ncbi:MAG: phosphoglycerate kinase [Planctomycetes bacterium]|nr:phosphoglycerate kinase [Planctomycetota bacterium]